MINNRKTELIQHIKENFNNIKKSLSDLVAIPGIAWPSYDEKYQKAMANETLSLFKKSGINNVEILSVKNNNIHGQPAVLASKPAAKGYPSILLYAHHDVQPEGNLKLWNTSPFKAVEKNGRLYGRGSADDKAGIMVHASAIKALTDIYGKDLKIGIKVFIEGEEEIGSPTFKQFIDQYKDKLEADAIIVADGTNWKTGVPALTKTLRGVHSGIITVEVLKHAVHSGIYGGPIIDALTCMSKIIASFHDKDGELTVQGLSNYSSNIKTLVDMDEAIFRSDSSLLKNVKLAGSDSIVSRLWEKPAITFIGIDAPSINRASNTIIPKVKAKYSLRIGPGQDPKHAFELIKKHVIKHAPYGVEPRFSDLEYGQPFKTDINKKFAQIMQDSLKESWGVDPVVIGGGGSIPFTTDLKKVFPSAEILITGVEDPDSRAHSPNESLHLKDFQKAIIAETLFLAECQEMKF